MTDISTLHNDEKPASPLAKTQSPHILIDSYFINDGGGKVLLDYLLGELHHAGVYPFLVLDIRTKDTFPPFLEKFPHVFLSSFFQRNRIYRRKKFSAVLCFGNVPPPVRLRGRVYTYFHQRLFLDVPPNLSIKTKLVYHLKIWLLKYWKKNTDRWLVQSSVMQKPLQESFRLPARAVEILPFYPQLPASGGRHQRIADRFLYVSNANPHKNHFRLIEAFADFYAQNRHGELVLTVGDGFPDLIDLIAEKRNVGCPIVNVGLVPRQSLKQLYAEAAFVIFPSLSESFGLGLIEGIEGGCKIIGADLPYTYAVCKPSIVFDPLSTESISDAFAQATAGDVGESVLKAPNEVGRLIDLLQNNA